MRPEERHSLMGPIAIPYHFDRREKSSATLTSYPTGSVNENALPSPAPSLSTQIFPPCASTKYFAIVRPMPLPPPAARERDLSTR
jgi:hypothetical protein